MRAVMQEKFGDKTKLKLVHVSGGLFRRNKNAAEVGAPAAAATASPSAAAMMAGEAANLVETGLAALEARAHWNRFGL
jgi:hypothetical protein